MLSTALVVACSATSTPSQTLDSAAVDAACEAANKRTRDCRGNGDDSARGCNLIRCAAITFRDAKPIAETMATRDCLLSFEDVLQTSSSSHGADPGVKEFVEACYFQAERCNDPQNTRFRYGLCNYYGGATDDTRAALDKCTTKPTCDEFTACWGAAFTRCESWN